MVMKAGMIGFNEGNGHPFSFSAIVNGYDPDAFKACGWEVILNYLKNQPTESFDINDVEVTHAWTPDRHRTQQLCAAAKIKNAVEHVNDMIGQVDVAIIARDDYETHLPLAKPFLLHGTPVFIDKPLTLNPDELRWFEPFLHQGLLMSTSGMRYAKELDGLRTNSSELGDLKLIEGVVLNNLEKYGIHMLDAVNGLNISKPKSITRLSSGHESYMLTLENGIQFNLNCLGAVAKTFHLSFYGSKQHLHFDLHDNFSAFKKTLTTFFIMARLKTPQINPYETLQTMDLLFKAKTLGENETITI